MKKVAAILMALVMGVPALAQPVCAATCGGGAAVRSSCCCSPKTVPVDGHASYTATPCCPSDSARADLNEIDTAVSPSAAAAAGAELAVALPAFLLAASGIPAEAPALVLDSDGPSATGPPLFLRTSALLL